MVKKYIRERQSWIYLFLFSQAFLLFVSYLDSSINFSSILYVVFLFIILFIVFLIIRYRRETVFYQTLKDWHPSDDIEILKDADKPFEIIVEESIQMQAGYYKSELDHSINQLEEEKDDLLSWIHEVKTPLTTMKLMLDRLDDDQLKSQLMYEWLRIHLLLDQQLHQRRMPAMENDLYIEKVDVKSILYKEIKELQTWCMNKGIGFDVQLDVKEVLTDVKWFSFIVRQLLTNAVKYSEHADIIVHSFVEEGVVKLLIQDEGRGIPEKDLPRIFDKGFTSTSNHQDLAATGMGLYLAKNAAEALKIHIDVQSEVEVGTSFTITFAKNNSFLEITSM